MKNESYRIDGLYLLSREDGSFQSMHTYKFDSLKIAYFHHVTWNHSEKKIS